MLHENKDQRILSDFLVASCVPDGGAYRYHLYHDGTVKLQKKIPMPSPMHLQLEKNFLWAVLRHPFDGSKESGIAKYDVDTGKQVGDILSTKGEVACHIAVDEGDIYCANYVSGSVFKAPACLSVHHGNGRG